MNIKNEWENEFPRLYKLFHNPLAILVALPEKLSIFLKKFILLWILGLMGFVITFHINQYFKTGDVKTMTDFFSNNDFGMFVWSKHKNFLMIFIWIDLFLSSLVVTISAIKEHYIKAIKFGLGWIFLINFLIFSYAIAELILKIVIRL